MTSWFREILIYEGEDEEALKARFIELSALHPHFDVYKIGQETFKGLKDAASRGGQAAQVWSNDLEVLEAIRTFKLMGGGRNVGLPSKEDLILRLVGIMDDIAAPVKERLSAIDQCADLLEYKPKPGPNVVVDNRTVNVLRVPTRDITPEDDQDFNIRFKQQQTQLVENVRSLRKVN